MRSYGLLISVLSAVLMLLVVHVFFGQSDFSGTDWLRWPQNAKLAYVAGWIDGRQAGVWEAVDAIEPDLVGVWTEDPRLSALNYSITAAQIIEGLDAFYSDYRNQRIELRSGIGIVVDEASGRREWPEDVLRGLRKESSKVPNQR